MKMNNSAYRIPSFARVDALNNHMFEVNDVKYEYVSGNYFKKVETLDNGSSFGEVAL